MGTWLESRMPTARRRSLPLTTQGAQSPAAAFTTTAWSGGTDAAGEGELSDPATLPPHAASTVVSSAAPSRPRRQRQFTPPVDPLTTPILRTTADGNENLVGGLVGCAGAGGVRPAGGQPHVPGLGGQPRAHVRPGGC